MRLLDRFLAVNAAKGAVVRCYGVPYDSELTHRERLGMEELERRGEVVRDEGGLHLHWHIHPARQEQAS